MRARLLLPLIITLACNSYSAGASNPEGREELDRIYVSLGDPDSFRQICGVLLTPTSVPSLAQDLVCVFKQVITDMKKEEAKGTPPKYFVPDIGDVSLITNPQKTAYCGIVDLQSTVESAIPYGKVTLAPELQNGGPCTEASVVYAYGVIIALICYKSIALQEKATDEFEQISGPLSDTQRIILKGAIRTFICPEYDVANIIVQCLDSDPEKRPKLDDIDEKACAADCYY
ncbi:MAG: hypothetical protein LBR89_03610 [Holosporales bacterium]|jgi:serine/threonine protein kinase|nr:hypothetical protein [Holosporales bacterium]